VNGPSSTGAITAGLDARLSDPSIAIATSTVRRATKTGIAKHPATCVLVRTCDRAQMIVVGPLRRATDATSAGSRASRAVVARHHGVAVTAGRTDITDATASEGIEQQQ